MPPSVMPPFQSRNLAQGGAPTTSVGDIVSFTVPANMVGMGMCWDIRGVDAGVVVAARVLTDTGSFIIDQSAAGADLTLKQASIPLEAGDLIALRVVTAVAATAADFFLGYGVTA